MELVECRYMELNRYQIYDLLRQARVARLAVAAGGQPYIVPMCVQWQLDGDTSILHMASMAGGRKLEILAENDMVALEIEKETCVGTDVVLAQGRCIVLPVEAGVRLAVIVRELSGRRYFLTEAAE